MEPTPLIDRHSSVEAKARMFRSLFRGREDVYARRFESLKTGKSGYAPACANEWVRGICEKPRVRCAECVHRRFLLVTDEVIRWHLSGHDADGKPFVLGVYPLLQDETCWFLAIDFDKTGWQEDAGPIRGPQFELVQRFGRACGMFFWNHPTVSACTRLAHW
jgi:hypothetical protein